MEVIKIEFISFSLQHGKSQIEKFLIKFFDDIITIDQSNWQKEYKNPVDMANIIGVFIDNKDDYKINMWISIDEGFSINVTKGNANQIIKYLFERFPY